MVWIKLSLHKEANQFKLQSSLCLEIHINNFKVRQLKGLNLFKLRLFNSLLIRRWCTHNHTQIWNHNTSLSQKEIRMKLSNQQRKVRKAHLINTKEYNQEGNLLLNPKPFISCQLENRTNQTQQQDQTIQNNLLHTEVDTRILMKKLWFNKLNHLITLLWWNKKFSL